MITALLVFTGLLVATAAVLFVVAVRRSDPLPALAGMAVMIVAGVPAIVYATLDS